LKYAAGMKKIARAIDEAFNGPRIKEGERKTGFVLLVFDFGDTGRCNYMSNAQRDDVVLLLKEQLARFEGQPEMKGHA
jgi:hypothetical protein